MPVSPVRKRAGFSLIEVTLAMGIVSFAVLSILGTFSVGLDTIHVAKQDTAHAQIIAQVTSSVQQTQFDEVQSFADSGPFFFDQSARQIDRSPDALYSAKIQVTDGGTYPGAPADLNLSAKTVKITVSNVRPGTSDVISSSEASVVVPKS